MDGDSSAAVDKLGVAKVDSPRTKPSARHRIATGVCIQSSGVAARRQCLWANASSTVGCFNEGATHLMRVTDLLAIETDVMTQALVESRDTVRIVKSVQACKSSTKDSRKRNAEQRKRQSADAEPEEGPAYEAGGSD